MGRANVARSIVAGLVATLIVTILIYAAPLAGIPEIDIAAIVGSVLTKQTAALLALGWWLGMIVYLLAGILIAPLVYAFVFYGILPGRAWLRGSLWGALLWLLMEAALMPLMGSGSFSSLAPQRAFALVASFIVFLIYGVLLGAIAGPQATHGRKNLKNKNIAILVADGFELATLKDSRAALEFAGAATHLTSPASGKVKGWSGRDWGKEFPVNCSPERADPKEFDALLIPGGVMHIDTLRSNPAAVSFVRAFFEVGKPVAAFSHGPVLLIDAGILGGCRLTSAESVRADLKNAGAEWVDDAVVTDNGLVTGGKPEDLLAFNRRMVEEFAAGPYKPRIVAQIEARPAQTEARENQQGVQPHLKEKGLEKLKVRTPEGARRREELSRDEAPPGSAISDEQKEGKREEPGMGEAVNKEEALK